MVTKFFKPSDIDLALILSKKLMSVCYSRAKHFEFNIGFSKFPHAFCLSLKNICFSRKLCELCCFSHFLPKFAFDLSSPAPLKYNVLATCFSCLLIQMSHFYRWSRQLPAYLFLGKKQLCSPLPAASEKAPLAPLLVLTPWVTLRSPDRARRCHNALHS